MCTTNKFFDIMVACMKDIKKNLSDSHSTKLTSELEPLFNFYFSTKKLKKLLRNFTEYFDKVPSLDFCNLANFSEEKVEAKTRFMNSNRLRIMMVIFVATYTIISLSLKDFQHVKLKRETETLNAVL